MLLRFIRVRHYARVFLNGRRCGEHYGSRAPFEVDVTAAAKVGGTNRLEVWVHHCGGAYAVPGGPEIRNEETLKRLSTLQAYRRQATIAEDVFLVVQPAAHIAQVRIQPSVREKRLNVWLSVTNGTAVPCRASLTNTVLLKNRPVLELRDEVLVVPPGETRVVSLSAPWPDPELWGFPPYGEPVLYHLESRLTGEDGGEVDRLVTRFGFREIWTEADKILLNGRPIRLLGYWQPEASGRTVWTLRMAAVQSAGCNTIHNHAEQREPTFYDVADELGLLVWDANFCGGPLGTTGNMDTRRAFELVEAELARQYPDWARVTVNHPSVAVIMAGCLIRHEAVVELAKAYAEVDPGKLLMGNGARATPPLDLGAYSSKVALFDDDPLTEIRGNYERWGRTNRTRRDGQVVPLVNSECWYQTSRKNAATGGWESAPEDEIASATTAAIAYFKSIDLAGVNLYSQPVFREQDRRTANISWPSRSGLGQHPTTVLTGGLPWHPPDYINCFDDQRPAFEGNAAYQALREGAKDYLGYAMPVANTRRPEVIVAVTAGGRPVPDAYVYAVPKDAPPANPLGMRTDAAGTAWFQLRDPGTYRFTCRAGPAWRSIELDAPLQPLDLSRGGTGDLLRVHLDLSDSAQ